jgi:hypothetical protein
MADWDRARAKAAEGAAEADRLGKGGGGFFDGMTWNNDAEKATSNQQMQQCRDLDCLPRGRGSPGLTIGLDDAGGGFLLAATSTICLVR